MHLEQNPTGELWQFSEKSPLRMIPERGEHAVVCSAQKMKDKDKVRQGKTGRRKGRKGGCREKEMEKRKTLRK